jgi:transaldolase / glucose-6-phosphate isomerase
MATQQVNERLAALTAAGTSVWLDQISRQLISSGELKRLVDEESLHGVTSNPAIFEKAILGADDYDDQLEALAREGQSTRGIFQGLAIKDVQDACDVLRPVFDQTGGDDGFVSLEVDPDIAFDTERTMEQAREYWQRVDRPNLMIKIPGTDEGVPAIEEMIYEGLNINVTLLFAVAAYERVAEAFIRGLERRQGEGKSVDMRSVASFFVSRVDTETDKRLEALDRTDLQGRAGLANARAAYRRFEEIFHGPRFAALLGAGAHVQRPLWASTGVKNPAYPDTMYVDGLVAPETVNTMPMATLLAAGDHAIVDPDRPTAEIDPEPDLQALAEAGIDLDDVTAKLLRDGVTAFVTPMEKLLDAIEAKREAIVLSRPATVEGRIPDALEPKLAERIREATVADVAKRIWRKDDTLWGEAGQPEVADRLNWLIVTEQMWEAADDLEAFADEVRDEGTTDVVLLGMGGSSLAPEVIRRSFGDQPGRPRLHVLDSTDAGAVRAVHEAIDIGRTLFLVSTKSGGTIETLSLFRHFWAVRPDGSGFVAITDPGSGLEDLAREHGFRHAFLNDPCIGGRYSALSYFGLVPAALMGADVRGMLDRSGIAEQNCLTFDAANQNTGLWLGLAWGELAANGRDKLTYVVDEPLGSFGLWVEQLIAESTGKHGKGIVPVVGEPLAAPEAYGEDRTFVYLRHVDAPSAEVDAQVDALARAGHPVIIRQVHGPTDLGRIFFFAEFAIAAAGWVLGINPFDQPNVQEAKDNTQRALDQEAQDQPDATDDELRALLDGLAPPHYLAIMGYVQPSEDFDAAVTDLRAAVRDATRAATTFGYGPRFLHSTGQLHKGGPPTGRFLQLVHDSEPDLEIPDAPYDFTRLKHAQAIGDLETLRGHDLPAQRVTLSGDDPAAALRALTDRIRRLL